MSNLVFPMPAPPSGNWQWPVKKTPSYKTLVQTPASNRGETRVSLTPNPIYLFDYDFSYLKGDFQTLNSVITNLLGFYQAVRGGSDDWLFQDPYDNTVNNQLIGVGNGSATQFQIGRTLTTSFEMMQNVFPTQIQVGGSTVQPGPQASGNAWFCGLENWLFDSQAFTQSAWVLSNAGASNPTVTDNAVTGPDGATDASTIAFPSTTGGYSQIAQTGIPISYAGTTLTFSVWLKVPSGTASIQLFILDGLGAAAPSSPNTVTLTTAWQRFSVTTTFLSVVAGSFPGVAIRCSGQSALTVDAWGAQFERWNSPTSYVLTTNNAPQFPRGLVTLVNAPTGGSGGEQQVTASFSYYYRCRFLEDEWGDLEEMLFQLWELKSLKFKSLIL